MCISSWRDAETSFGTNLPRAQSSSFASVRASPRLAWKQNSYQTFLIESLRHGAMFRK